MSALDDLDRAIAAECNRLATCETPDCQDGHLDLINECGRARKILAAPNPDPEDKRHALAILHTARTATGGTP